MADHADPGWVRALPAVLGIVTGRQPKVSILLMMRAIVLLLTLVVGGTALGVLIFGAGSDVARIDPTIARIGISAALGGSVIATSFIGRAGPDTSSEAALASDLFQISMRRALASVAVGPAGLMLSWLAADSSYVIFGSGLALLLTAVAGPSLKRIKAWEAEVAEAGSSLSVRAALDRPWN
jgi:hypothetical protein